MEQFICLFKAINFPPPPFHARMDSPPQPMEHREFRKGAVPLNGATHIKPHLLVK